MKLKYVVVKLMLLSLITGCTQLEESNENVTVLSEEANENVTELPKELSEDTIVPKDSKSYASGGTFITINSGQKNQTIACVSFAGKINKAIFLETDDLVNPSINVRDVTIDSKQIALCDEYLNMGKYTTHIAILPEDFQYTTSGYILDSETTNLFIENNKATALDLNSDNRIDYLDTCSSMEGEHFNAWDNEKKTNRLAHIYMYINADLIATCEDIDYPDIE